MTEEPKRQDKDPQESEKSNRWDKIKGFFLDNPTLALTLLYLYATGIGMGYSAVLYGSFGINVFDYSEITDFLLAAFKNPFAIGAGVVALASFVWSIATLLGSERHPWSMFAAAILVGVTSTVLPPIVFARQAVFPIKDGETPAVDVRYRSFSGSAGQIKEPNLRLIGTTEKAVFFYDVDAKPKRTIVIPQSQLVSIEVPEQD